MSRLARGEFESQLASPRASRGESEILGLVARRGETIPGDGLGEAIPTLGPRGESHVRLARLASTRLVLISGRACDARQLPGTSVATTLNSVTNRREPITDIGACNCNGKLISMLIIPHTSRFTYKSRVTRPHPGIRTTFLG